jgi:hypothetical protein
MKKLLVSALATASLLSSISSIHAADVKFSGDFRVRGFYTENVNTFRKDTGDTEAFADERFRLRTNVTSGIASGVIALDVTNGFKGDNVATFQNGVNLLSADARTGNTRLGAAGFGDSHNVVGVREAYLKFQFPMFGATAGRSPFKLGHGLVLDDVADAISINGGVGPVRVMVADLKLCDTHAGGFCPGGTGTGSDSDFYIVNLGLNHMEEHHIGLFAGYLNDRGPNLFVNDATVNPVPAIGQPGFGFTTPASATQLWVFGASADGSFGMVRLGLEADFFSGKFKDAAPGMDITGLNLMANAGVMVGPADVGLLVLYGSGQDTTKTDKLNVNSISPDFVLGNILLYNGRNSDREGGAPSFGTAGILAVKLSAGFKALPMGIPGGDIAVIWAQTAENILDATPGSTGSSKDIGLEIDLNFHHRFDENLMLNVGFGYLMPGDAVKFLTGGDDNAFQAGAGLTYTF